MIGKTRTRSLMTVIPLAIGFIGILLQSLTYLNHDVAWVLYSSEWLLEGKQFGRDIIDSNPPFAWWFSAIPQAIARAAGVSSILIFRVFVTLTIFASLAASNAVLRAGGTKTAPRFLFLSIGAYVFTTGVHRDFGQREFLTVLLIVPYLLTAARRMRGQEIAPFSAVAIGLAAGYGIAFKPYFLAVPTLVELALILRLRSFRTLYRPEALGGMASAGLCLTGILLFARPWLTDVLPEISKVYWAFDAPLTAVVVHFSTTLGLLTLSIFFVRRTGWPEEAGNLLLAAVGFAISALVQAKGYSYHIYPAIACMLLALALCAPRMIAARSTGMAVLCVALGLNIGTSFANLYARSAYGRVGDKIGKVVAFVEANVPRGGSFLAISTHPYPGFPTAIYADRRWASLRNSRIILPAVVRLRTSASSSNSALLAFAEKKARDATTRDIEQKPDLVLVDVGKLRHAIGRIPFDFLGFYLEDPEFRLIWSHYERMPDAPEGYAAYRRMERASSNLSGNLADITAKTDARRSAPAVRPRRARHRRRRPESRE
jgi:hypothetical protein